jgi:hypothetical protein
VESKTDSTEKDSAIVKNYFPVRDFIATDLQNAETYYTAFHKFVTKGNRIDSAWIQPEEFKKAAAEFMTNDLTKTALETNYKETSFLDQTIGTYTFTYSTTDPELQVQRVDVLAAPGEGFDKIRSVYIEKRGGSGKQSFVRKMFWKVGSSMQVITTWNLEPSKTENIKIVWNQ